MYFLIQISIFVEIILDILLDLIYKQLMSVIKDVLQFFGKKEVSKPSKVPDIIKLIITSRTYAGKNTSESLIISNSYTSLSQDDAMAPILRDFMYRCGLPAAEMKDFQFQPGFIYDCSSHTVYRMVRAEEPTETEVLLYTKQ